MTRRHAAITPDLPTRVAVPQRRTRRPEPIPLRASAVLARTAGSITLDEAMCRLDAGHAPGTELLERFEEKWRRFSVSEARQIKDMDQFDVSTKR